MTAIHLTALLVLTPASSAAEKGIADDRLLSQLRFSPDGQYVLAQDDSGITVLTVRPLSILFRIAAHNATFAHFTPTSQQVVFMAPVTRVDSQRISLERSPAHVERWSVADGMRVESTAVLTVGCETEELSPDARFLVCVDFGGRLRLIDVVSGETIIEKKQFSRLRAAYQSDPNGTDLPVFFYGDPGNATVAFSPDGAFMVAGPANGEGTVIALDLGKRTTIKLPRRLRVGGGDFTFIAPDRLLMGPQGFSKHGAARSTVVTFPSGRVLSKPWIPDGPVFRTGNSGFALIRPFGANTVRQSPPRRSAAVEIDTGQVIISETPALDVFGRYYITQHLNGEVALYQRGKGVQATVALGR